MFTKRLSLLALTAVIVASGSRIAWAGDIKLTVPKRSQLTRVQSLNREGVDAVRKQRSFIRPIFSIPLILLR